MPLPAENVTQTNGLATAALVLGILPLVLLFTFVIAWVLGILAVVFGGIGVSRANQGAPTARSPWRDWCSGSQGSSSASSSSR
jgi:hypothetical protein